MVQYSYERLQPGYADLWARMTVLKAGAASQQAQEIIAHKDRYKALEARTKIKWFVLGCLNMRESSGSFITWLHNGDRMKRNGVPVRTVNVPAHRPPNPDCTWEDGGYDAIVICEHLGGITDWSPERVAYVAEGYNGWGYRNPSRNIPSPYLWGGTNIQERGKFGPRDGEWNPDLMDPQIGVMAVLKQLMALDPEARFDQPAPVPVPQPAPSVPPETPSPAKPDPEPEPEIVPANPKAIDTESQVKPLHQSKTIWGGVIGAATTAISTVSGFISQLNNPYTLAAFLALLAVAAVALYLVVKGRVDINAVVKHLAVDDSQADAA